MNMRSQQMIGEKSLMMFFPNITRTQQTFIYLPVLVAPIYNLWVTSSTHYLARLDSDPSLCPTSVCLFFLIFCFSFESIHNKQRRACSRIGAFNSAKVKVDGVNSNFGRPCFELSESSVIRHHSARVLYNI
jgi:hypothetical protein